jgi:HAD superfamily hydrolase (TIGR01509 family)
VDSSAGVTEATNFALTRLGYKTRSREEISGFIGYPLENMFGAFCGFPLPIEDLKAAFQEKAAGLMEERTHPLPGAEETIELLHNAGYRLAIATTKYKIHTEGIVSKFGWEKYFSALASGDEVKQVKPAPDIVKLALRKLGIKSDSAVMVGDTVNDIISARDAGVRTISIVSPFGRDDIANYNPDLILENIQDLKSVFKL